MNRRTLLVALGSSVGGGILVYEALDSNSSSGDPEECQVSKHSLSTILVSPSLDQRKHIVPIEYDSLDGTVRKVFAAALDGETLRACPTKEVTRTPERALPEALQLVQDAVNRQMEQYDQGRGPDWIQGTAYLRRDDELYAISATLSDDGVSQGATPPNSTTA